MRKFLTILLTVFLSVNMSSQEVCEDPNDAEVDLNSISVTKCSIKESKGKKNKKTRQISVRVSANKRYLKKREAFKKKAAVSGMENIETAGIENSKEKSELSKTLSLKTNIADITKKLSAEEVRSALKFTSVDRVPQFKACKKAKKGESMDCFNEEMMKHISKHFRYPSEAVKRSIQGEVWVRFIIDKNGDIRNVKTLGPKNGDILNKEAIRVVSKLPQFAPAKKDGGRTSVKYGFPIAFSLDE